jgi:hypothetical protein
MAVPIASYAQRTFTMPRWLGLVLLTFMLTLALGMVSVIGAAARESTLDPGATPAPLDRRRGMRAMAITAAIAVAAFYLAFDWWSADARNHELIVEFFKPPGLDITLQDHNRLLLKPSEEQSVLNRVRSQEFFEVVKMVDMIPDHGHLMHVFMIRMPAMDRLWHLHPERTGEEFVASLPAIDAGRYQVFADLVHKSGFPFTMVGAIDLPQIAGRPLAGDDAGGSVPPIGESSTPTFALPDGGRIVWQRDATPIRANAPMFLRFEVQEESGRPAADLQPYMEMAAHAAIVRSDLSVFAHIHPTGSVPMASMMMADSDGRGGASSSWSATSMAGMSMARMSMAGMAMPNEKIAPEISVPYGFPRPGAYRIFLQFKRHGAVETAVFDATVQ